MNHKFREDMLHAWPLRYHSLPLNVLLKLWTSLEVLTLWPHRLFQEWIAWHLDQPLNYSMYHTRKTSYRYMGNFPRRPHQKEPWFALPHAKPTKVCFFLQPYLLR